MRKRPRRRWRSERRWGKHGSLGNTEQPGSTPDGNALVKTSPGGKENALGVSPSASNAVTDCRLYAAVRVSSVLAAIIARLSPEIG